MTKPVIDMTNKRFGNLIVITRHPVNKAHRAQWICMCKCGKQTIVVGKSLRSGYTKSCGCLKIKAIKLKNTIHGHKRGYSGSSTYQIWESMKKRCLNPRDKSYKNYGGRGITICSRWYDFINFLEDMGEKPLRKVSLDRINNNLGYSKENCRWADILIQANNKRSNHIFNLYGKNGTITQWARWLNIDSAIIRNRICKGKSFEEAIS